MLKKIREPAIIDFTAGDAMQGKFQLRTAHKIIALLAGTTLLVALAVVVSFWAFRQIGESAEARKHNNMVLGSASDLLSSLKDAETGERGYLITGDEAFLEPYSAVKNSI